MLWPSSCSIRPILLYLSHEGVNHPGGILQIPGLHFGRVWSRQYTVHLAFLPLTASGQCVCIYCMYLSVFLICHSPACRWQRIPLNFVATVHPCCMSGASQVWILLSPCPTSLSGCATTSVGGSRPLWYRNEGHSGGTTTLHTPFINNTHSCYLHWMHSQLQQWCKTIATECKCEFHKADWSLQFAVIYLCSLFLHLSLYIVVCDSYSTAL